jgi:hypothetical protein
MSGNTGKENWGLTDEEFEQAMADVAASVERAYEEERLLTAAAEEAEQLDAERLVEDTTVTEENALEEKTAAEAEAEASTIPFKVVKVSQAPYTCSAS